MSKLGKTISQVIKGSFLADERMASFFPFAIYVTGLALVSIYSAHSADRKVHRINQMEAKVNELESEHFDIKSRRMQLGLESKVADRVRDLGLKTPDHPPVKLTTEDE